MVVIGAGLGGLAAAAALARAGVDVEVIEKHLEPGGHAGSFVRGGFRFEQSLHLVDAIGPGEPTAELLDELGAGGLSFARPALLRRELGAGGALDVPWGDAFVEAMSERFPASRRGLAALLSVPEVSPRATAEEVVRAEIADARLIASIAAWCEGWLGRPLSGLPARELLVPWASYHLRGGGYPLGGSAAITGALVRAVEGAGGRVSCGTGVRRVIARRRRVEAVELEDGRKLSCTAAISCAPPEVTFRDLELPADYRARLSRLVPSTSCVKLWLGLDAPLGPAPAYDTLLLDARLSLVSPRSLSPDLPATLAITRLVPAFDATAPDTGEMIAEVERALGVPLAPRVRVTSLATPATFARYTGHPGGAIYGGTISGVLGARLAQETPIDRLFLAGAWTRPGAGYSTVLRSGRDAAQRALATLAHRASGGSSGAHPTR